MAKLKTATRTIHNAGRLKVVGQFHSYKNGVSVSWESQVERDLLYCLEFAQDVASYVPQPETFEFWLDGKKCRYTPDVRVTQTDGEIRFKETKAELPNPESVMALRLNAAQSAIEGKGYALDIVCADEIRRGHFVTNIRLLYRYAQWLLPEEFAEKINRVLPPAGLALGALVEAVGAEYTGAIYRLMYDQFISVDMEAAPISFGTPVRAKQ